jgi:small-conductance mechanosensitive channel
MIRASLRQVCLAATVCVLLAPGNAVGQDPVVDEPERLEAPATVDIEPVADDGAIAERLTRILEATGWFENAEVRVDEGVVFLSGTADSESHRDWAGQLALSTQGVVAAVNQVEVTQRSPWDLSDTWIELRDAAASAVRSLPRMLVSLVLLLITYWAAMWSIRATRRVLERRIDSLLLRQVLARAAAIPVLVFGLYLVLKLSGLTGLAFTLLGGTGLVGLIIGFAFRDIAENFLASILISSQHPFAIGDLIEVDGHKGFVQRVNTRSTLIMTLEGNHVQIPNATVYKGTIINYTANPRLRSGFAVGIGYDASIKLAQETALRVLQDHPAVVAEPEPLVLVDSLGAATVNLSVLYWIDASHYSQAKVLSAVIRLTKRAFDEAGISMPDEAREVVFPDGVPLLDLRDQEDDQAGAELPQEQRHPQPQQEDDGSTATESEGDLRSESREIQEQADSARVPEGGGRNLLDDSEPEEPR